MRMYNVTTEGLQHTYVMYKGLTCYVFLSFFMVSSQECPFLSEVYPVFTVHTKHRKQHVIMHGKRVNRQCRVQRCIFLVCYGTHWAGSGSISIEYINILLPQRMRTPNLSFSKQVSTAMRAHRRFKFVRTYIMQGQGQASDIQHE